MSAQSTLWALTRALAHGFKIDVASTETLKIRPYVTDQGAINIGDGTNDIDFKVFLGSSTEYLDCNVGNSNVVCAAPLQVSGLLTEKMTQTALVGTATVTAAQLLTKIIDGTPTAAATYTLPTAALLVAAIAGAKVGDSFMFVVNNKSTGANTITVAAGSGGTGDGTLTVAQNVIRSFLVTITNVTASSEAYFVYGIG